MSSNSSDPELVLIGEDSDFDAAFCTTGIEHAAALSPPPAHESSCTWKVLAPRDAVRQKPAPLPS
eukprot:5060627-Prymnesium_polylepis.1